MNYVLVIDDDPAVLGNLVAFLEDEDFNVLSADSADKAYELIQQYNPKLAIVDMRLPGIDGNDLIRKAHELLPSLQFLVHTGSSDYVVPDELVSLGVTKEDVFKKPVSDMTVFRDAINRKISG